LGKVQIISSFYLTIRNIGAILFIGG
jgi:hypothetical protein